MAMVERRSNARRVLILDDESEVAATLCMMAATAGYETDHTGDADVFLRKVVAWDPTHVVVDLQLADRDGIAVMRQLAEMGCKAGIIIVSGLGARILDSSARAASENGLWLIGTLPKPFFRNAFLTLLGIDEPGRLPEPHSQTPSASANSLLAVSDEDLVGALNAGEFIAHFQPKISCSNGALVGFECLARWPRKGGGMTPPIDFISRAEHAGLIHDLTRQIFRYALASLPASDQPLKFALNLSAINLEDEDFPLWLLTECQRHGVTPSQIILEVTETASMNNPLALLERLTRFRIQGFQLSIDDFGVGYSSLVQLARLPFSELKIDQMFVGTISSSEESRKIVTAVVGLGKSLGLNVVAEGVEDEGTLDFLRGIGCDEAQGYFIGRPMPSLSANAWRGPSWGVRA